MSEEVQQIVNYVNEVADALDRQIDFVAESLKHVGGRVGNAWGQLAGRPAPPPPPPPPTLPIIGRATAIQCVQRWISRNRALTAALFAFFGTGAVMLYREKKAYSKKRRAKRASNGARSEVVVIAGPSESPLVLSLSQDLERRGFIVYVVVGSAQEESRVQSNGRADIRPLYVDITEVLRTEEMKNFEDFAHKYQDTSAQQTIERFNQLLANPHHAIVGATPHKLNFAGFIIAPDLDYASGPVEMIKPHEWADAINVKVLGSVYTVKAFLQPIVDYKAKVIMLTPTITHSMKSPFQGVESTVVGALNGFVASLTTELRTLGVNLCHFKLGTFDYSSTGGRQQLQKIPGTTVHTWPASTQSSYGRNFIAQSSGVVNVKGSPLRVLHNAVFDALVQKRPRQTWRIGRGSIAYEVISSLAPTGLVGWILGLRSVNGFNDRGGGGDEMTSDDGAHSGQWEKVESAA
ncbi:MAG: hypothetical protein M1820_007263 [Bogoriella megaspora]|nr:MAG: hypothetical protein M1820_007263 [Bogoriella megaspora]